MAPSFDRYTEVTSASWRARLRGAIAGVVLGLVVFTMSFPLLFWNEGRAIRRQRALAEGQTAVRSVASDAVDAANEGALVHVTGRATTDEALSDTDFEVSAVVLKLRRDVEMYQWRETSESKEQDKLGGDTETVASYDYERVWADRAIDSSAFETPDGHRNPSELPFSSQTWNAHQVRLGVYELAPSQVARIDTWSSLTVSPEAPIPPAIAGRGLVSDGGYYVGDPAYPSIGDLRVRFSAVYPHDVSVVARQVGQGLAPHHTSSGGSIDLVQTGAHDAATMFASAQTSTRILTWVLRLVGMVTMFVGLAMALRPLVVLADVVPILGNMVEAGTGLIALLIALLLSLLTIAVAWLFYRPVLAIALLTAAGMLVYVIQVRMSRARPAAARG